ncbi:FkbM family methyltransferase [Kistimonas asteriae]|uniref:FkbM family methyltransferase n=1 Tax=Kistimonas asteriae TaxID=517724 RepID=UPI001BAC503C|nr:FkbM family methyltransferase [Kistimonas asteriae]
MKRQEDIQSTKRNRFIRQFVYYFLRYLSEKNSVHHPTMVGFSYDAILHKINVDGLYEVDELEALSKVLGLSAKRNSTALDIGANIGNHSIYFSKFFSKVIAFEPNPKTYRLLGINTEDISNIEAKKVGLSDKKDILNFKIDKTNWGASRITGEDLNYDASSFINVHVESLDDVLSDQTSRIELIKIDVEGHELRVLQGAKNTIEQHKPIILFEEACIREGSSEVIDLLRTYEYRFFVFEENFFFGESKVAIFLKLLLQDIFRKRIYVKQREVFDDRFYHFIIAIPNSKHCLLNNVSLVG